MSTTTNTAYQEIPTAINRGSTIFLITTNGKFIEIFELTIRINFKKKKITRQFIAKAK